MNLVPVQMTIEEKIQRLKYGEVFYTKYRSKIFYDENAGSSPFRFEDTSLDAAFRCQWYKEQNWYENIPEKGVPCWVWDDEESDKRLRLIVEVRDKSYSEYRFLDDVCGVYWRHARPATKEELFDE